MNIVMLDDERISLAVLKNHVSKVAGTRGFAFTHPTDALRWCASNEADAVVIDFMMHEMDGLEFVECFRLLPGKADVPILMVTGSHDVELRRRALLAGVTDFFTKPLDVAALRSCLSELIAQRVSPQNLPERTW
jgi:PleD family two-component response regulator